MFWTGDFGWNKTTNLAKSMKTVEN
jgi:hypothetical protein